MSWRVASLIDGRVWSIQPEVTSKVSLEGPLNERKSSSVDNRNVLQLSDSNIKSGRAKWCLNLGFCLGRSLDNGIIVPDPAVSRNHLVFRCVPPRLRNCLIRQVRGNGADNSISVETSAGTSFLASHNIDPGRLFVLDVSSSGVTIHRPFQQQVMDSKITDQMKNAGKANTPNTDSTPCDKKASELLDAGFVEVHHGDFLFLAHDRRKCFVVLFQPVILCMLKPRRKKQGAECTVKAFDDKIRAIVGNCQRAGFYLSTAQFSLTCSAVISLDGPVACPSLLTAAVAGRPILHAQIFTEALGGSGTNFTNSGAGRQPKNTGLRTSFCRIYESGKLDRKLMYFLRDVVLSEGKAVLCGRYRCLGKDANMEGNRDYYDYILRLEASGLDLLNSWKHMVIEGHRRLCLTRGKAYKTNRISSTTEMAEIFDCGVNTAYERNEGNSINWMGKALENALTEFVPSGWMSGSIQAYARAPKSNNGYYFFEGYAFLVGGAVRHRITSYIEHGGGILITPIDGSFCSALLEVLGNETPHNGNELSLLLRSFEGNDAALRDEITQLSCHLLDLLATESYGNREEDVSEDLSDGNTLNCVDLNTSRGRSLMVVLGNSFLKHLDFYRKVVFQFLMVLFAACYGAPGYTHANSQYFKPQKQEIGDTQLTLGHSCSKICNHRQSAAVTERFYNLINGGIEVRGIKIYLIGENQLGLWILGVQRPWIPQHHVDYDAPKLCEVLKDAAQGCEEIFRQYDDTGRIESIVGYILKTNPVSVFNGENSTIRIANGCDTNMTAVDYAFKDTYVVPYELAEVEGLNAQSRKISSRFQCLLQAFDQTELLPPKEIQKLSASLDAAIINSYKGNEVYTPALCPLPPDIENFNQERGILRQFSTSEKVNVCILKTPDLKDTSISIDKSPQKEDVALAKHERMWMVKKKNIQNKNAVEVVSLKYLDDDCELRRNEHEGNDGNRNGDVNSVRNTFSCSIFQTYFKEPVKDHDVTNRNGNQIIRKKFKKDLRQLRQYDTNYRCMSIQSVYVREWIGGIRNHLSKSCSIESQGDGYQCKNPHMKSSKFIRNGNSNANGKVDESHDNVVYKDRTYSFARTLAKNNETLAHLRKRNGALGDVTKGDFENTYHYGAKSLGEPELHTNFPAGKTEVMGVHEISCDDPTNQPVNDDCIFEDGEGECSDSSCYKHSEAVGILRTKVCSNQNINKFFQRLKWMRTDNN